jgi:RHS repeat-associated protein
MAGLLLPAAASAAECTDTWKGGAEGTWITAANWTAGHQPTASDVACIGTGKTVSINSAGRVTGVLQGGGTLAISGVSGSLEITNTEEASRFGSLVMEANATVSGPATLYIETAMNLHEGRMSGSGSTVIEPGATVTTASGNLRLSQRHFVNDGTFNQTRGTVALEEGAEFVNYGVFSADTTNLTSVLGATGTSFVNEGLLRHTTATSVGVSAYLRNEGRVEVLAGNLKLTDGGMSSSLASWEAASGATLYCEAGSYVLRGLLTGNLLIRRKAAVMPEGLETEAANVEVEEATLEVPLLSTFSVGTLTLNFSAKVKGSGALHIENALNWSSTTMSGSGTTVIEPGAIVNPTTNSPVHISQRRFVNDGTFNQTKGTVALEEGAEFLNAGTFTADTSSPIAISGLVATFVNSASGLVQKTAVPGITKITAPFANDGRIRQATGHLEITNKITVPASTATPGQACAGEPVSCATGNFFEKQTDLEIGGRGVGLDLTRTYSAQAAAAGLHGIFGYGWTNSFGNALGSKEGGARETLRDASGRTTTFIRSGTFWRGPEWSKDTLTGSAEAGFTLTLPDQTKEKFSAAGRLESVTDRNGNETTLAYNGSGELEAITDPTGRSITLTYNSEGLVETAKDPMGHEVRYAYESKQLKSVTLPGEASPNWQFKYDASHRMVQMTDGRGGRTINEYDGSNRVVSQTDPMERRMTWEYEAFHTTITDEATGAVTDEWFNSNNQPLSITHAFGTVAATTTTLAYSGGLLISKTDGNGHTTTYGYNGSGDRTSETDPEGNETTWAYNAAHQVLTETKPSGEKTTIVRDANGNPETVSRPAPKSETQTVAYEYGPRGELETMTDPLGDAWTYGYDSHGDRTSETDPEGDERTWAYDEDSRVISTTSPRGNEAGAEPAKFTTAIERDPQGRPLKVTDPLGGVTKYAYDADGNVESVTDPNGHKTKFTYDADDEQTKVEKASGAIEETGYDGASQVTSQTDGDKHKTTYVRNVLEQPVETIDPLERKTTRTFDAAGNLLTKTDPDGRTTTYGYDKANRLKEVSYSAEPAQDTTFSYDEDGDLTGMVDGTGTSTYEYDQLGRLIHSEDGNGEVVSWEWNLGDEPVGLTYPNGESIARGYDEDGRLESVTDWLGHTTTFAYNPDSALTVTTFPIGTGDTDEYSFDRADRMSGVTMKKGAETLASLAYTRDPAGQLESLISKGLPGAETESFSYDENERLTKAGAAEFGYDAANNPTKAPGTTNAFDKASQIETATGTAFSFDKEGERTKEAPSTGPATTYKYDQAGSLTAVERAAEGEVPAVAESFGYDGTGLLASRTVGLSTRHLVWDLTESPEALLSDGEDSYIYGPDGLPIEQISSGEVPTYLHHDELGSSRLLTNASGEATGTFTYGPYGGSTGHTGTTTTVLGYAGQYTLGQSGLLYLRARYYDPATAQFLTLDPAVEETHEPYGYAGDNPLRFKDPTGLWFAEELGGVGIPCPWCGAEAGATEALEEAWGGVSSGAGWVYNQLGTEELDEGEGDEAQPCGESTDGLRYETKGRGEVKREEEIEMAKLGHVRNSNPDDSGWQPSSGGWVKRVVALVGKLIFGS